MAWTVSISRVTASRWLNVLTKRGRRRPRRFVLFLLPLLVAMGHFIVFETNTRLRNYRSVGHVSNLLHNRSWNLMSDPLMLLIV